MWQATIALWRFPQQERAGCGSTQHQQQQAAGRQVQTQGRLCIQAVAVGGLAATVVSMVETTMCVMFVDGSLEVTACCCTSPFLADARPACTAMCHVPCVLQLVSSDVVTPFGIDSIRVCGGFMFVGMSREDEGIVKVYNLAQGGTSHQLTGHKVKLTAYACTSMLAACECCAHVCCKVWACMGCCWLSCCMSVHTSTSMHSAEQRQCHQQPLPADRVLMHLGWLQGQVYSLAYADKTLFTAGQDTTIRVWNLNEQAGIFVSQVGRQRQRDGMTGVRMPVCISDVSSTAVGGCSAQSN